MSGVRDRGLDMSVEWDNTSKRHNYTTRRSLARTGQVDLLRLVNPVGDLNRGLEAGFLALARGKKTQRLTQVWGRPGSLGLEININK